MSTYKKNGCRNLIPRSMPRGVRKADKYKMRLRKRIKGQTDFGFSFAAVNCPSCGGSFDARNVKACPYCDNEYLHEENDWVITEIK